jgi:hypothetical protein
MKTAAKDPILTLKKSVETIWFVAGKSPKTAHINFFLDYFRKIFNSIRSAPSLPPFPITP